MKNDPLIPVLHQGSQNAIALSLDVLEFRIDKDGYDLREERVTHSHHRTETHREAR